ncbi:MAG: thymidine kinase, partial [bacterium]|nr:thymidine kinase [bacterium]
KPLVDNKGDKMIISRLGLKRKVDILASPDIDLSKAIRQWDKDVELVDCVLADEAQFFTTPQIDQLFNLSVEHAIPVICYGIRTDFQKKLFPGSKRLFELAHSLEELKTICRCGSKALFNGRKQHGKFVFDGNQIAVDGASEIQYESLCGKCYARELKIASSEKK